MVGDKGYDTLTSSHLEEIAHGNLVLVLLQQTAMLDSLADMASIHQHQHTFQFLPAVRSRTEQACHLLRLNRHHDLQPSAPPVPVCSQRQRALHHSLCVCTSGDVPCNNHVQRLSECCVYGHRIVDMFTAPRATT